MGADEEDEEGEFVVKSSLDGTEGEVHVPPKEQQDGGTQEWKDRRIENLSRTPCIYRSCVLYMPDIP